MENQSVRNNANIEPHCHDDVRERSKSRSIDKYILPQIDNLQNIPIGDYQVWLDELDKHKKLVINDIEEIKDSDSLQYDNLKRQGIHSIIAIPIYNEGNVVAFMGIGNPPLLTLKYALSILEIMSALLYSCIKRKEYDEKA